MNFEVANYLPIAVVVFAVAALALALTVAVAVPAMLENRKLRVARQQSIPAYYGRLLGAH